MTTVLVVIVGLVAVLMFVLLGAQMELFEQVKQIRKFLDLEDRVTHLDLELVGAKPSQVGLPSVLDEVASGVILLLSNKCATCQTLATTMQGGRIPSNTWILVVPVTGDGSDFLGAYDLQGDRVLVDRNELIVGRLGINVTPAAIFVQDGRLLRAQTVPSVRHLRTLHPVRQDLVSAPQVPPAPRVNEAEVFSQGG